tara:strand:+ start:72 stop:383 length:312 start_codon:yes stop_codon:yes gene_type:complete
MAKFTKTFSGKCSFGLNENTRKLEIKADEDGEWTSEKAPELAKVMAKYAKDNKVKTGFWELLFTYGSKGSVPVLLHNGGKPFMAILSVLKTPTRKRAKWTKLG